MSVRDDHRIPGRDTDQRSPSGPEPAGRPRTATQHHKTPRRRAERPVYERGPHPFRMTSATKLSITAAEESANSISAIFPASSPIRNRSRNRCNFLPVPPPEFRQAPRSGFPPPDDDNRNPHPHRPAHRAAACNCRRSTFPAIPASTASSSDSAPPAIRKKKSSIPPTVPRQ